MNNVIISGRLTADPKLKTMSNIVSVCTFIVVADRNTKDDVADFPIDKHINKSLAMKVVKK